MNQRGASPSVVCAIFFNGVLFHDDTRVGCDRKYYDNAWLRWTLYSVV